MLAPLASASTSPLSRQVWYAGTMRILIALTAVSALVTSGCGKRQSTLVEEYGADFAAMDAKIAQAKAEVAKVPERGTKAFPRCKRSKDYVYGPGGDGNTIDFVPGSDLGWEATPLASAMKLRKESEGKGRFSGPKATDFDVKRLAVLKRVKHLIIIREQKTSTEHQLFGDVFVVNDGGKIACAFGFDGGEASYGSAGKVTGKEVWTDKRSGKVVREREVVEGATSGTSGTYEARKHIPLSLARNLGVLVGYDEQTQKVVGGEKGLGEFPSIRIKHVLEDRNAPSVVNLTNYTSPFGPADKLITDGVELASFQLDKHPHVAIGREQAVNADASPDGRALAEKLAAQPFADEKELLARARALGYTEVPPKTPKPNQPGAGRSRAGVREYSVTVKNAAGDHFVQVIDYSAGAQKRGTAFVRVVGRTIVSGEGKGPVIGSAAEILNEAIDGL